VRAVVTDKRPCALTRGELRRVPQERTFRGIVGYHVGCPSCGFVTPVLHGVDGRRIVEHDGDVVTFTVPARCLYCRATIALVEGELAFEGNVDVS
jgi:hypothetical protein